LDLAKISLVDCWEGYFTEGVYSPWGENRASLYNFERGVTDMTEKENFLKEGI
jgi:hypothetical protein